MRLMTEGYLDQKPQWPESGRHILAQYDAQTIVVYQAYKPSIGRYAVEHQFLGGDDFQMSRMSWIKPNFLWMMHRCGWGRKENQECVLAIWLRRSVFDTLLEQAVHSAYAADVYENYSAWQRAVARSSVRLQWDPDHDPSGNPLERRAIQLGLRGDVLHQFAQGGWITHIEDISAFAAAQHRLARSPYSDLLTPTAQVYTVSDEAVARKLGLTG
jgi:Domain of unknown function (DUF4291)